MSPVFQPRELCGSWEVLLFGKMALGAAAPGVVCLCSSGSFQHQGSFLHALKQNSKRWKTQRWPRLKKSMSSALFEVLILVNYRAAICNLSGRWIQLNWKRANLKVKVFYFLCEIKGPVEFPAFQIYLGLKACCAP